MRRADYEIYTFKRGDRRYWAFDVEYFGHYVAKSPWGIKNKVKAVKILVANRLEEIDRLNKEYYERLNRETEELAAQLKAYRELKSPHHEEQQAPVDKKEMLRQIRDMLLMGASYEEVLDSVPNASPRIVSHVRSHLVAKKLL